MKTDPTLEPKWKLYRIKDIEKLKQGKKDLLVENFSLKEDLEIAEDGFEKAKIRNIFLKAQLFKLGQAVDTLTEKPKGESDHE